MRKKWIPLLVIALLIISPFSTASKVFAMDDNHSQDVEQSGEHPEEGNNRTDNEEDTLENDKESEEIIFQLGDEDEVIQTLKEDLTELGFAELENPTEYFGLHTEEAVKAFQEYHDIEDTGIVEEDTLQKIEDVLLTDSFDREEHLEFSEPEAFETEEEEFEQETETEEGSESEEEQESETEEDAESEEEQESETEEDAESEEEQESETEEDAESEEEQESETEEDAESEEEQESETEEDAESEEEQESETEEDAESEEEQESETEEDAESEEEQESETEEDAESEEEQESETEEGTESEEEQESETEKDAESEEEQKSETEEDAESEEEQKSETEEDAESEEEQESETEEDAESEEEQESETEEDADEEQQIGEQNLDGAETFSAQSTYQRGDRHEDMVEFKEQLNAIGFGYITETTLFGSFMETQVTRFQEYYGLTTNGQLDQETQEKLDSVYNSPFQQGKRHDDIPGIKEKLNNLGYGYITETTLFGSFMEQKIEEFQSDYGLRVNGIADEVTLEKLDEVAPQDTYQRGDRHEDMIEFKNQLNAIGFGYITETTLFGSFMESQVTRFQEYYGLTTSGELDQETQEKLDSVYNSPFQQGKRHDDIPEIKEKLNNLGYGYITETTLFGSFMEQKVEEFQSDYGLRVSGIADEVTLEKLDEVAPQGTYQRGDRHEDMIEFKEQLNAIGFGYITETTLFGSFMETQVKRFQEYYNLSANGQLNQETQEKLDSVYNSSFQQGKRHDDIPEIKEKLNTLGYGYITETTLFGSFMKQKVEEFQRDQGLRVNGIVDEVTLSQLNQAYNQQSTVKIFLDPGHGAHDPGGQGYGLNEKDVVLDIALETERILTSKYQGVEVEMSRRTDTFVELTERANQANQWGADYFVSFHNNAHNGSASGFESYIYNGNVSQETRDKQNDVHSYISSRLNVSDRGQKSANLSVLRNTNMPAILIEYLFIDNFTENALLKSDNYKNQLAQYTADAIADSYNLKRQ
ncbi:peptidoglycan-binding protein [Oceanobacillus timonensis]|uniref:peptidoglycan-binding protein n=1 Tax=Oceanobacillus timonensis TaxID=1926285 RepID=UPI0009BB4D8F|nr:peptidoglycan-binding protein [Oceanobacillus timonensis]